MGARRRVFRRALIALAALAWAGSSVLQTAAAAPYQPRRTPDYSYPISIDFWPKIWFHERPDYIVNLVDGAQKAIRACRLREFNAMLDRLTEQRDRMRADLANLISWADAAKGLLRSAEKDLEFYDQERKDAYYDFTRREFEGRYQATVAEVAKLKDLIENGPARIAFLRQDIQSLTTVINWLSATPHDCPEEAPLPPPPPPQDGPPRDPNDPGDGCPADVIAEINRARADPDGYADRWRGGDRASLDFLRQQPTVGELDWNPMLADAAQRLAADRGANDHTGSDGSRPMQRIHDAGLYSTITAEVIAKGQLTAPDAVHQLIIDLGNPTHPHRSDLFNPGFTLVGVACALDRPQPIIVIDLSNPPMKRDE